MPQTGGNELAADWLFFPLIIYCLAVPFPGIRNVTLPLEFWSITLTHYLAALCGVGLCGKNQDVAEGLSLFSRSADHGHWQCTQVGVDFGDFRKRRCGLGGDHLA